MIPELSNGLLPDGIWDCTIDEVADEFVTNATRTALFDQLQTFFGATSSLPQVPIFVDGSFVTDKDRPRDIDICVDLDGLDQKGRRQWEDFFFARRWYLGLAGIDFWVRCSDFREDITQSEYPRIKAEDADRLNVAPNTTKGFLRVK